MGCTMHTEASAEIFWRDVFKRAFSHHGTIFLGESERCKHRRSLCSSLVAHNLGGRACYGMEWKIVWNGRRILVWNMEDAQNGKEDLKNGMEDRLPY